MEDEVDALFGKRMRFATAAIRYADIEVSYLPGRTDSPAASRSVRKSACSS
jgi:hypothetical protein